MQMAKKIAKKAAKPVRCACQSASHGHRPGKCVSMASERDGKCKFCHSKTASEAAVDPTRTIDPLNQPRSARSAS
jgi:hypothetical protein